MEGVEFTMTFLRVIKWISFIVFILALALTGVAHGFIFNEMGLYCKDDVKYNMADVRDVIAQQDDIISSLFNKKDKKAETEPDAVPTPVVDGTASEAAPIENETAAAPASPYSCKDVNNIIVSVMKYGSHQIEMGWLNKLSEDILGAPSVKINLSVLIAYIALFVAFILHLITKHNKSFYGYLLMFFGYILYAGILLIGYYVAASIGYVDIALKGDDMQLIRTYTIIGTFVFATLVGLPYYRLGIRQIANKTYKKRIDNYKKKLQRRSA